MKHIYTTLIACLAAMPITAQIPAGYYSSLAGKKGSELKTAIYQLIKDADVLEYGSGTGHTWEGFYATDRDSDNAVIDRYSNEVRYFTSAGAKIDGMNIEHSFPKSWWGGAQNQAYQDLYNLMPCEQSINSKKSNFPMGEVTSATTDNGCTKVGTGYNGYQLWEPADKWKGDFARGYMYMATAYQNLSWSGTQAEQILTNGDYPTLQEWAYTLYIIWARADKVDSIEIRRNDAVSAIQGNRNPYVDFPNLMEYVWGDSIEYAFDPTTSLKTSTYDPEPAQDDDTETILFNADFTASAFDCTIDDIDSPTSFSIWQQTADYGWKASGYYNKMKYDADSRLVTPEISFEGYEKPVLTFRHAVNYCASPADVLAVEIMCEGNTETLTDFTWGTGSSWKFVDSGDISLADYAGKTIQVAFHYTSTSTEAATWEVKSMEIRATRQSDGIQTVTPSRPDMDAPYSIFTIDGRQLQAIPAKGMFILRQDGHSWKFCR